MFHPSSTASRVEFFAWTIAFIFLVVALASTAQETMPVVQNSPGFKPAMSYQDFGKGESVNAFNGGLVVSHPSSISLPQNLGTALTPVRVYNSKSIDDLQLFSVNEVLPPHGFLGLGWTLSFGRIQLRIHNIANADSTHPSDYYVARAEYFYVDESGAEHRLYLACSSVVTPGCGIEPYIGAGQVPASSHWYVTNDGSYIRARYDEPGTPVNSWTVFFPDGSTRILGGQNAYLQTNPSWVGSGDAIDLNHYQQGWYTTQIKDRAGNIISISYYAYQPSADPVHSPYGGAQPYMGAINQITDQFSRVIQFSVFSGDSLKNGLVQSITMGSFTESYDYAPVNYRARTGINMSCPALTKVVDAGQLQTLYGYDLYTNPHDGSQFGSVLDRIDYPTGATSSYHYTGWTYTYQVCTKGSDGTVDCEPQTGDMFGVDSHTEYSTRADGNGDNTAVWSWNRGALDPAVGCITNSNVNDAISAIEVVMTDPMGQQSAHFFSCEVRVNGQYPPGKELAVFTYHQGTTYSRASILANAISQKNFLYRFCNLDQFSSAGDAARCVDEYFASGSGKGQNVPLGNPRVRKTLEIGYSPSGAQLWSKTVQNDVWDGYGHYLLQQTTGTALTGIWIEARNYQLFTAGSSVYQLDRLALSYSGTATSVGSLALVIPAVINPPDPTSDIQVTGNSRTTGFKLVRQTFTDSMPVVNSGLLLTRTQFRNTFGGFTVHVVTASAGPSLDDVAPTSTDPTGTLTYSPSDDGNISSITYSGGQDGTSHAVNFTWQTGVPNSMQWSGLSTSYPEWTRGIDTATSRISSESEAGMAALTTSFSYDALGRITSITPPGGEYPTKVSYPLNSKTRLGNTWTVGYQINLYRGLGSIPPLSPPTPASGLDPLATYTQYLFDDFGRLWKTDTLMPGGSTWTERTTGYDPFGMAVFASEPYAAIGTVSMKSFPLSAGSYSVPYYPSSISGSSGAYGTWTSIFSDATPTNPFTATSSADDLHRALWMFAADQSTTGTQYDYKNNVSGPFNNNLPGIITAVTINGTLPETSYYTRDILGRLAGVTPPQGAAAAYTFDGLGHVIQANLAGQSRSFSYDALGHVTSANNPESGTVSYTQYDALGQLLQYTNGLGTVNRHYDAKGRLTDVQNSSGSTLQHRDYDQNGAQSLGKLTHTLAQRDDGTGKVEEQFFYDPGTGRLTRQLTSCALGGSLAPQTFELDYSYDLTGQVQTLGAQRPASTVTPNFSSVIVSSYQQGFLTSKAFSDASSVGVQNIKYSPSGSLAQMDYYNGGTVATETLAEDPLLPRLKNITLNHAGSRLWTTGDYAYDGAGNITAQGSNNYKYDLLNRIQTASVGHLGTQVALAYALDQWGNLTTRTMSGSPCGANLTVTMDPANNNRIQSVTIDGTSSLTFKYDNNGNLLNDGQNTASNPYSYDVLNELKAAIPKGSQQADQYYYDADGERVAMSNPGGPTAVYYLRGGAQVLLENKITTGASPADHVKAYLYEGSNLAATEEWDQITTYSISGTVSGAVTSGVTISLTGASTGSTTTGTGGTYTLSGLANGSYTVTPSLSGYTFSPTSTPVTISSANVTGINFTATAVPTYSISGTVSGAVTSGVTITLTGAASKSTTTGTGGTFSFSGLANGSYTVTPSLSGYTFSPTSIAVTISGANQTGKNFTAAATTTYSISGTVSGAITSGVTISLTGTSTGSTTTGTGGTYTLSGLANGSYTVTPSLSGYTFSPGSIAVTISGANQTGKNFTAAATTTYSISGTVSGAVTSGVTINLTGASTASTTTVTGGTYTFSGLANGSYTVTPSLTGYTFSPTSTAVTISSANVTGINFTATAVPTYSISGTVSGAVTSGVAINLTGASTANTTTSASGMYSFSGLVNGSYTVTPSLSGYTFSPTSTAVTISGANQTGISFTATAGTYTVSGVVMNGSKGVGGVAIKATMGTTSHTVYTATTTGAYTLTGLTNGTWTLVPSANGSTICYAFSPASLPATVNGANQTGVNFTATIESCLKVSGTVTSQGSAAPVPGVRIDAGAGSGVTDSSGAYQITGLQQGTFVLVPSMQGYKFKPSSVIVTLGTASLSGLNFTAVPASEGTGGGGGTVTPRPSRGEGIGPCRPGDDANEEGIYHSPGREGEDLVQVVGSEGSRSGLGAMEPSGDSRQADSDAVSPTKTIIFYACDHLGTVRVVMKSDGTLYTGVPLGSIHDYEPFGIELQPTNNPTLNTHQFTGQERDLDTSLDYMHFRYYSSSMGRFMKPDNVRGNMLNPQSWNLYSYVGNNPVSRNDPTGHMTAYSTVMNLFEHEVFGGWASAPTGNQEVVAAKPQGAVTSSTDSWSITYSQGTMADLMKIDQGPAIADAGEAVLYFASRHTVNNAEHTPLEGEIVGTTSGAQTAVIPGDPPVGRERGRVIPAKVVDAVEQQLPAGASISYAVHPHIDAMWVDNYHNAPTRPEDYSAHQTLIFLPLQNAGFNTSGARMAVASPNGIYVATFSGWHQANVLYVPWAPLK